MAVVAQPLGSSEARGSVGGYTYSSWRGKATVRARSGPSDPPTQKQLDAQALLATASARWRGLSEADRAAWREYASSHVLIYWTGEDLRLPGFQWFVRLQCNLLRWDRPNDIPDPWPVPAFPMEPVTLEQVTNALVFIWTNDTLDPIPNAGWESWIAGPHSPGRQQTLHDARFHNYHYYEDDATFWLELATGYYTVFYRPLLFSGQTGPFGKLTALFTEV